MNYYRTIFGSVDAEGNKIERTKAEYPYNYDSFTVYINKELVDKITHVQYSDRLFEFDADKFNKCCMEVWGNKGQHFYLNERTPEKIEKFLSLYHEKPVTIVRIKECCNQASGYPLWCFYFADGTKK